MAASRRPRGPAPPSRQPHPHANPSPDPSAGSGAGTDPSLDRRSRRRRRGAGSGSKPETLTDIPPSLPEKEPPPPPECCTSRPPSWPSSGTGSIKPTTTTSPALCWNSPGPGNPTNAPSCGGSTALCPSATRLRKTLNSNRHGRPLRPNPAPPAFPGPGTRWSIKKPLPAAALERVSHRQAQTLPRPELPPAAGNSPTRTAQKENPPEYARQIQSRRSYPPWKPSPPPPSSR